MDLNSKKDTLEYFSKKYKSGISNLILLLNSDIIDNKIEKIKFLDLIAIIKKDGFKNLTKIMNENINEYSNKVFKNFIDIFFEASKKYDQYNELKTPNNVKFRDYMEIESKKTIKQDFDNFVNILINSNQKFDIKVIDKISKNLNINYELSKEDIKNHWYKNTFYYLKNQFSDNPLKINSSSKEFDKFFISNLKNNSDNFINSLEKLGNKYSNTDQFKHIINLINNTIENNNKKINKIDNIINILADINDKTLYKIDLLKEKINKNEIIYNEFKEKSDNQDINKNKLIEANLMKEELNREINSNINEIIELNKKLEKNIKNLNPFNEYNIDR